jgi:hypothetical protein
MKAATDSKHSERMGNYSDHIAGYDNKTQPGRKALPYGFRATGDLSLWHVYEASDTLNTVYVFGRNITTIMDKVATPQPSRFSLWKPSTEPKSFYAYLSGSAHLLCPDDESKENGGYCFTRVEVMSKGGGEGHPDGPYRHKLVSSMFNRFAKFHRKRGYVDEDGFVLEDIFYAPNRVTEDAHFPFKQMLYVNSAKQPLNQALTRGRLTEAPPSGEWEAPETNVLRAPYFYEPPSFYVMYPTAESEKDTYEPSGMVPGLTSGASDGNGFTVS